MKLLKLFSRGLKKLARKLFTAEVLFAILLILNVGLISWIAIFQVHPKIISGINYYKFPIIVKAGDKQVELDSFDAYNFKVFDDQPIVVSVIKKDDGRVLETRTHQFDHRSGIAFDLLSEHLQLKLCFIKADVTNIFFPRPGSEFTTFGLEDVEVISANGVETLTLANTSLLDLQLYPNHYSATSLPEQVEGSRRIFGVYPVQCESLGKVQNLADEIYWWANYNAQTQRELYSQKLQEVLQTQEYN